MPQPEGHTPRSWFIIKQGSRNQTLISKSFWHPPMGSLYREPLYVRRRSCLREDMYTALNKQITYLAVRRLRHTLLDKVISVAEAVCEQCNMSKA